MERYLLNLNEIQKQDIDVAGGKGANLGEMISAQIPVPHGFVVTAQAYDRYMQENHIDVTAIMENMDNAKNAAAEIRKRILKGTFPADISEQLLGFYHALGEKVRVAVRSSATAEDLEDASFAGQQETYLNVIGEEMLLEKTKECYASLWGERAVSYRQVQGYASQKVFLAVVIQQMVESDCAGVCFTQNPAGNREDILINASYGLGEAVVSGLVSPDEYICSRDGQLQKAIIGAKEQQIIYDKQGTKTESVQDELRSRQVLDKLQIEKLARLALEIETHYGHPMDIEWAVKDNALYILQARSITTLSKDNKVIFTDADFADLPVINPTTGRARENMLFNLEKMPLPYYPLDHDFGDLVGKQKEILFSEIGIQMKEMCPIDRNGISSFCFDGMKVNRNIRHLPAYAKQMLNDDFNIRRSKEALQNCTKMLEKEVSLSYEDTLQLGEALVRMQKLIADTAYARFRYAIFPQVVENISLNKTLKKVNKELNSFDLMEGLSYVTADINRELANMAAGIKNNPAEYSAVLSLTYDEIVKQFPTLGQKFTLFLNKYGNKLDFNCYCFVSKSWKDEPARFLSTLRTMLRGDSGVFISKEDNDEKFKTLMTQVKEKISTKAYAKFARKVTAVRHYHYIREATQYLWESEFAHCRNILKQCAKALGTDYEDLLFLFASELIDACRTGELRQEHCNLIRMRKAKRPLAECYWKKSIEKALSTEGNEITGVCGSAGSATGRVCIVKSPAEFDKLNQGEILVCPYTDPEWTPLFTLAAGVVVDTGGSLSHAAIVAREYKIPAVLATGDASKRLKDGELVIVDGSKGKVFIV